MKSYAGIFKVSLLCLITTIKSVQTIGMTKDARTATHAGNDFVYSVTMAVYVSSVGGLITPDRLMQRAQRSIDNIPQTWPQSNGVL